MLCWLLPWQVMFGPQGTGLLGRWADAGMKIHKHFCNFLSSLQGSNCLVVGSLFFMQFLQTSKVDGNFLSDVGTCVQQWAMALQPQAMAPPSKITWAASVSPQQSTQYLAKARISASFLSSIFAVD
jgi:hypothetical protein